MKRMEKPMFEIVYFTCNDVITTSDDHDNGFINGDELARVKSDKEDQIL